MIWERWGGKERRKKRRRRRKTAGREVGSERVEVERGAWMSSGHTGPGYWAAGSELGEGRPPSSVSCVSMMTTGRWGLTCATEAAG